tara:strand:- start:9324 stop:9818 length:495 start_codon:yes stop_codon:yes gene_type:complete
MFLAEGLVEFPTARYGCWDDTTEGHTIVCLVVLAEDKIDLWDEFPVSLAYPEGELMGDNLSGSPLGVYVSKYMFEESVVMADDVRYDYFPTCHYDDRKSISYSSVDFCCFIPIGVIKWTGFDTVSKRYWYCSLDDLDEEGILLYKTIENLYKDKSIRLVTFIKV